MDYKQKYLKYKKKYLDLKKSLNKQEGGLCLLDDKTRNTNIEKLYTISNGNWLYKYAKKGRKGGIRCNLIDKTFNNVNEIAEYVLNFYKCQKNKDTLIESIKRGKEAIRKTKITVKDTKQNLASSAALRIVPYFLLTIDPIERPEKKDYNGFTSKIIDLYRAESSKNDNEIMPYDVTTLITAPPAYEEEKK